MGTLVGVISDTHGLVRPAALAVLAGATRVVHAGDVGAPDVLDALRRIAPVTAVRGNNDRGGWARGLPARATLDVDGCRVLVVHDRATLRRVPAGVGVVVSGHSHRASVEQQDGVLFLNPGSAGPRRFRLPIAVALLHVSSGRARAEIVPLGA